MANKVVGYFRSWARYLRIGRLLQCNGCCALVRRDGADSSRWAPGRDPASFARGSWNSRNLLECDPFHTTQPLRAYPTQAKQRGRVA